MINLIKKVFFLSTGQGYKLQQMHNNEFKRLGGNYGENFKCYSSIITSEPYLINIGNNVTISSEVTFITHDNSVIKLDIDATDTFGKINIGDNCFIGANSTILPGVILANNIIVGAGSVVSKSFNEGNIVIAGNPAKKICNVDIFREKNREFCHNIDKIGRENKKEYLLNLSENYFIRR